MTLGRLTRLDLLDIWKTGERGVAPWLAQAETLTAPAESRGHPLSRPVSCAMRVNGTAAPEIYA
jgi:hypothetical protein